jgi:formate hydrogenlyase subunit 6/NADH:ubiquinone oxidoreductase subunit I
VQSCPRHALSSTPQFELANDRRDKLKDLQK